jgi:hypothetical protein
MISTYELEAKSYKKDRAAIRGLGPEGPRGRSPLVHKIKHNSSDGMNRHMLIMFDADRQETYATRSSRDALMNPNIFPRNEIIKRSFFYSGLQKYNRLPREIRDNTDMIESKRHFKEIQKNETIIQ